MVCPHECSIHRIGQGEKCLKGFCFLCKKCHVYVISVFKAHHNRQCHKKEIVSENVSQLDEQSQIKPKPKKRVKRSSRAKNSKKT